MNEPRLSGPVSILIVEDEQIVALDIQLQLAQLGYQVAGVVSSGREAIAAADQLRPQLILMDIQLQDELDGVDAAALIRERVDVPIVFLTAHTDSGTRARVRALAPYGYLMKPFDERMLEITLEMTLARYSAEQRTRASEQWLTTLLASLGDGVVATDIAGNVTMLNPVAEQLLGVSAGEAMGRPIRSVMDLYDPESSVPLAHPIEAALAGADTHLLPPDTLLRRPDGSTCRIDDSLALIRTDDHMLGAVIVFRDSTSRRLAEQARVAQFKSDEAARQRERLKVMAGGIAHDLNNMLTGVLGNIQLAMQDLSSEHPAYMSLLYAEDSGQRAADLTRQLLAYAGRGHPQRSPFDLNRLITDTIVLLPESVRNTFAIRIRPADHPLIINADATQIRQAMMNLVINAAEAMSGPGGLIDIMISRVDTRDPAFALSDLPAELAPGRYALLQVGDNGGGMDAATLERIFEPFFSTKFAGRGLGMAMVQGIVHDHQGAVTLQSALGHGTTASLWLPEYTDRPQSDRPATGLGPWHGAGTVLVIDDEEALRTVTARILRQLGFMVLSAPDGPSGLQLFQAQQAQISCVIVDLTMPGMSGREVVRAIRTHDTTLPVIVMSGYSDDSSIHAMIESERIRFLPKPFSLGALRDTLRQAIE